MLPRYGGGVASVFFFQASAKGDRVTSRDLPVSGAPRTLACSYVLPVRLLVRGLRKVGGAGLITDGADGAEDRG